jgi:VanZ family protein
MGFAVILTLCWLPASTVQEPKWFDIPNADKAIHFVLFCLWAFCLQWDVTRQVKTRYKIVLLVLSAGIFTALLTELLQPVISNRTSDLIDGFADISGTMAGLLLFRCFSFKDLP